MWERLESSRTRTGFLIAGSFHSPFRHVFVCLCGAMAKLDMQVCGDVCGEEFGGDCMRGCFVFGCVDVDCVGGDGGRGLFEFL